MIKNLIKSAKLDSNSIIDFVNFPIKSWKNSLRKIQEIENFTIAIPKFKNESLKNQNELKISRESYFKKLEIFKSKKRDLQNLKLQLEHNQQKLNKEKQSFDIKQLSYFFQKLQFPQKRYEFVEGSRTSFEICYWFFKDWKTKIAVRYFWT